MPTANLGLTVPVGGTTPGALSNTTPGTYPYIEAANLAIIDAQCYSAGNPPPGAWTSAAAAPSTGTWALGSIVWNSSPTAGGNAGWICISAGTPGTWKQFGPISP